MLPDWFFFFFTFLSLSVGLTPAWTWWRLCRRSSPLPVWVCWGPIRAAAGGCHPSSSMSVAGQWGTIWPSSSSRQGKSPSTAGSPAPSPVRKAVQFLNGTGTYLLSCFELCHCIVCLRENDKSSRNREPFSLFLRTQMEFYEPKNMEKKSSNIAL